MFCKAQIKVADLALDPAQLPGLLLDAIFQGEGPVVELGLGRGLKTVDKRQLIAKRDADREARRELADRSR